MRFVFLAALLILLTACAVPTRVGGVTPQGSQVVQVTQNAPKARVEPSTPIPTAGPDIAATLVTGQLWATQTERAYEREIARETAVQQVINNTRIAASATALPSASVATERSKSTDVALQVARITQSAYIIRATDEAPALLLEAANAKAAAGSAEFRAWTLPFMQFAVGLTCIVIAVLLVLYVFKSWRSQAEPVEDVEPDPHPELEKLPAEIPQELSGNPPGDTAKFSFYAEYALAGGALGINSVERSTPYTRAEYSPVLTWMQDKEYMAYEKGTGLVLNDPGREKCIAWLVAYPPSLTYVPKPEVSRHSHD